MLLKTDNIILDILLEAQSNGNTLLKPFHIQHPSKRIMEESNSIFVACVSSENLDDGYDFSTFKDLVEILIVTKQLDYSEAIELIKGITIEICRLLMINQDRFPNKPTIRSINPEFNRDYVLTRGHIMVQVKTSPTDFSLSEEDYNVCSVILDKIEID